MISGFRNDPARAILNRKHTVAAFLVLCGDQIQVTPEQRDLATGLFPGLCIEHVGNFSVLFIRSGP